jgi:mannose-1-phosphate guanylyltransferase
MTDYNYALIMAGGIGSRFWPVSTEEYPKQFHDLLGTGRSLLQQTFDRIHKLIPAERIFVLTNQRYVDLVHQQLPQISFGQIIAEPVMRNTAPCLLFAALKIHALDKNANLLIAPSDHYIQNNDAFIEQLIHAFTYSAKHDVLITLGIPPKYPHTGYGYIETNDLSDNAFFEVKKFHEKPKIELATLYLEQGNFVWNAGIFIWRTKTIIEAFKKYQPQMYQLFSEAEAYVNSPNEYFYLHDNYPLAESISIDYAILEHASNVVMLPATFDWNDLGAWGALYDELPKNKSNAVVNADVFFEDANENIVFTEQGKRVFVRGISNFIIIQKDDVLLIYPKNAEQDIKNLPK